MIQTNLDSWLPLAHHHGRNLLPRCEASSEVGNKAMPPASLSPPLGGAMSGLVAQWRWGSSFSWGICEYMSKYIAQMYQENNFIYTQLCVCTIRYIYGCKCMCTCMYVATCAVYIHVFVFCGPMDIAQYKWWNLWVNHFLMWQSCCCDLWWPCEAPISNNQPGISTVLFGAYELFRDYKLSNNRNDQHNKQKPTLNLACGPPTLNMASWHGWLLAASCLAKVGRTLLQGLTALGSKSQQVTNGLGWNKHCTTNTGGELSLDAVYAYKYE